MGWLADSDFMVNVYLCSLEVNPQVFSYSHNELESLVVLDTIVLMLFILSR